MRDFAELDLVSDLPKLPNLDRFPEEYLWISIEVWTRQDPGQRRRIDQGRIHANFKWNCDRNRKCGKEGN
jgi:hypothetical protein